MSKRLRETELSSELVYEGVFLKLRRDQARMPDGAQRTREYLMHPGAAAMVPLLPDGRVLVERQFRYPLRDVFVEIPAGKLDPGESPLDTARRELIAAGMPEAKLARVVGLAASDLLEPDNPRAPLNRRITITVLTHEAEERLLNKKPVIVPAAELAAQKSENPASTAQP